MMKMSECALIASIYIDETRGYGEYAWEDFMYADKSVIGNLCNEQGFTPTDEDVKRIHSLILGVVQTCDSIAEMWQVARDYLKVAGYRRQRGKDKTSRYIRCKRDIQDRETKPR